MTGSLNATQRRPNVLFLTGVQPPQPCGVGDNTALLAASLRKAGTHASIATGGNVPPQTPDVHAVVTDWDRPFVAIRELVGFLRRQSTRIVNIQYPGSYGEANRSWVGNVLPWLARAMGFRVVVTLHEFGERSLQWKARAYPMALAAHRLVCVTTPDTRILSGLVGLSDKVSHIPIGPGIVFDRICPEPSNALRLGYFGFLHPLKGLEELLQAVALARTQSVRPIELQLHGYFTPERTAHHAQLLELVRKLNLESIVTFPGPVPADSQGAAQAFATTDLAVLPFREGLSERRSSFFTLGAAGIPALTSPGIWTPDWVRDGKNCHLVPLTPTLWAERLCQIAQQSEQQWIPMGQRLRDDCLEHHGWEQIAARHQSLYAGLLS